jgi:hypothetical protein
MDKPNVMSSPRQLHFDSGLQAELDEARQALRRLEEENRRLRDQLEIQDASAEGPQPLIAESVTHLSPEAKIALFRMLFRGRDDVYAQRWEAADGRHGYGPVLRPGVRRIRGQPVTLDDCLPLSDRAIRNHLEGGSVLGIYPMQLDETTAFLAIDFDKTGWSDDVRAVTATCGLLGVSHALERSRSGNGAHIWVFFERPIPASLARNLGSALLTGAIDRRHQISFASYDRLFPSQVSTSGRSGRRGSNSRHRPWKGRAQPTELLPRELAPHLGRLVVWGSFVSQGIPRLSAPADGSTCSRVSIVGGQGMTSTLVTPTSVNPAIVSVICSTEPVIATPNPVASTDFASPGSTHAPTDRPIVAGRSPSPQLGALNRVFHSKCPTFGRG